MNFFIFVTQSSYNEFGRIISANDMLQSRLNDNKWPIYTTTRHKNDLSIGDIIFFYVGGYGLNKGCILASAQIKKLRTPTINERENQFYLMDTSLICEFDKITIHEKIELKPCLISGGIIKKDNKKWGAYLMGGIKKIDEKFAREYLLLGADK